MRGKLLVKIPKASSNTYFPVLYLPRIPSEYKYQELLGTITTDYNIRHV